MANLLPTRLKLPSIEIEEAEPRDPRIEIFLGAGLIGLFLVGFLAWSALVPFDAAVHCSGVFRVRGEHQAVQSAHEGVVASLNVREGDHVRAGQLLVELSSTDERAQERALATRVFGLQAEIARIQAEQRDVDKVVPPADWVALNSSDRALSDDAIANEQANLTAHRLLLTTQKSVLQQRVSEVKDQIEGFKRRQGSNVRQRDLNTDELDDIQELYKKGYSTKTRVLALERSAAAIDGDIGATQTEMARLQTTVGETQLQIAQISDQQQRENLDRLSVAAKELQAVQPEWKAARERLALTQLRAPSAGAVIGLTVHTIGGVVAAGQTLLQVVPAGHDLTLEAQVSPSDASDLRVGMTADARISALRGRDLPVLHGVVRRVSADSFVDDKNGRAYYTASIDIPPAQLEALERQAGAEDGVRPGTPADVLIRLRARSALRYWLEPLITRFSPALTEQ